MKKQPNLSSNIWKFFLFSITQRRHYMPILSIFFLTLPDTTAKQIGIYTAAGFLASFLLEIPSGYISDRFGHKKTLVMSKVLMVLSTFSFIIANSLPYFIAGSVFLSVSFAFSSGTNTAFMHNTLASLNREREFSKIMSKLSANTSLVSAILTILLPFLTPISIILPLLVNIVIDFAGLFFVISLVQPKQHYGPVSEQKQPIFKIIKKATRKGFYPGTIFIGAITGFIIADSAYKYVYLESIGLPIILMGFVVGVSRIIWFLVGHWAHKIEEYLGVERLLKLEILFFPLMYVLTALMSDPYVVAFLFALANGYMFGRNQLVVNYFINYITNKNYKATMLSVMSQISQIYKVGVSFGIGFAMYFSYKLGFFLLGILLLVILIISHFWFDYTKDIPPQKFKWV